MVKKVGQICRYWTILDWNQAPLDLCRLFIFAFLGRGCFLTVICCKPKKRQDIAVFALSYFTALVEFGKIFG